MTLKFYARSIYSVASVITTLSFSICTSSIGDWVIMKVSGFPLKLMKPWSSRMTSYWNISSTISPYTRIITTCKSSRVCLFGNLWAILKMSSAWCKFIVYFYEQLYYLANYTAQKREDSLSFGILSSSSSIFEVLKNSSLILFLYAFNYLLRISTWNVLSLALIYYLFPEQSWWWLLRNGLVL